jgi:light-independent protochlorophyllide reductase subunit B
VRKLLEGLGVAVNVVAPLGARPADLARLGDADFNVVLYPEVAGLAASWLKRNLGQPHTAVVPIGVGATRDFLAEVAALAGLPAPEATDSRMSWYARSVDSTYLTGKRVFVFGDATHAIAAARIATEELGFQVVGLGSYAREQARELREAAKRHGLEALITDDYLEVEAAIAAAAPELVLGTQMERHVAKRLGIPCAVISAPVHVQDFPARHSPQMGFEGANVIFDTWVHPLMMGPGGTPDRDVPRGLRVQGRCALPSRPCRARPQASTGGRGAGHIRLGHGSRAGAAQDPVLRARQGPAQHRELCAKPRHRDHHRGNAL